MTIDTFEADARRWLGDNLAARPPHSKRTARGLIHRTVEDIATQRALQKKLYTAGYAGISWPIEYGGQGLTGEHQAAFDRAAESFQLPDLGIAGVVTIEVCAKTILRHGDEAAKRRHIPRMLSGDELWVEFFSEPGAGSDLAGVTTTAERVDDGWQLNGVKVWSSGAYFADFGLCLARTDWDVPKHQGLTWFAVPTSAPGVTVEPLREITGDVEFCRETFDDVLLADDARIGPVGAGWTIAGTVLALEREASSGGLTGRSAIGEPGPFAPDLVEQARRAGRLDDQHVRTLIARAHTDDYALRLLGGRLNELMEAGHPAGPALVSYAKLAAGTIEPNRARAALEVGGSAAIAWPAGDHDALTYSLDYLNSRVTSIAGGTNEIQRGAIGERVLGLPREPAADRGKTFREIVDGAR
ncbi:MAG: acyl-CoA dehydrogenase protein [Pseudonocardiales bacterium]|nr:acyl-CoA dehydrogenase protein [Pseudonocardiales bacterium]